MTTIFRPCPECNYGKVNTHEEESIETVPIKQYGSSIERHVVTAVRKIQYYECPLCDHSWREEIV